MVKKFRLASVGGFMIEKTMLCSVTNLAGDVTARAGARVTPAGTAEANFDDLSDSPTVLNDDPYGDGWMLRIRIDSTDQLEALMDASKYLEYIA